MAIADEEIPSPSIIRHLNFYISRRASWLNPAEVSANPRVHTECTFFEICSHMFAHLRIVHNRRKFTAAAMNGSSMKLSIVDNGRAAIASGVLHPSQTFRAT